MDCGAIIAAHLLPLPLFAIIFPPFIAAAIATIAAASLAITLHQQRPATAATHLSAHALPTAGEEWWLRYANGKSVRVELAAQINFGWGVLLLLKHFGKTGKVGKGARGFRVVVPKAGQSGEVHRLRVRGKVGA